MTSQEKLELERGRDYSADRAWLAAHESLSRADSATPLGAEDLELLATAAYMLGHDADYLSVLERAHRAFLDAGEGLRAARCAFWVGVNLATRGEMGGATGWLGRAQKLVDAAEHECVEQGYLLLPLVLQHAATGDHDAASSTAADASKIGERFGDPDLVALAGQERGSALLKQGLTREGLALLDEAMVAVTAGELSPIVTGLVYCSVIDSCQEVYALRRAQEWTAALTRWCEEQPDMVSFTGRCLVHRAEIMQLRGAWKDALEEARRAGRRFAEAMHETLAGYASYRQGEVHRLQGEPALAEDAFREASRRGWEPQPGLALLRLGQGDTEAASAGIGRVMGETTERLKRARLLPAYVEILLAAGDTEEARNACRELEQISADDEKGMFAAMAAQASGALDLADGDAPAALVALRRAWRLWQELRAPYEAARARVLVGLACRALRDEEAAALELEAARDVFAELGATPDVARVDVLGGGTASGDAHGLTSRELQVLRMVAAGKTNKAIAAELILSERTIDRHVSNIFAKLGVSSRTAATAFAYEHQLV